MNIDSIRGDNWLYGHDIGGERVSIYSSINRNLQGSGGNKSWVMNV